MIKFESKKGAVSLKAEGDVVELCTDVCMCINSVWQSLNEKSNDVAESFKFAHHVAFCACVCGGI